MSEEDDFDEDDAIVQEFLIESYENLDALDREFVELERSPEDREIISSIFRTIHTIKGTSGFLAFTKLETVTHRGENLLSQLREGEKRIDPEITNCLLSMVDAVRDILASIEATGKEGDGDYTVLIENLERLTDNPQSGAQAEVVPQAAVGSESDEESARSTEESGAADSTLDGDAVGLAADGGFPEAETTRASGSELAGAPSEVEEALPDAAVTAAFAPDKTAPVPSGDAASPSSPGGGRGGSGASRGTGLADSSIRVDVRLLDKLMNQVGELVLARNQVLQYSAEHSDASYLATCQRLNQITTELQEGVMKTRMQPIRKCLEQVATRGPGPIESACGKQVSKSQMEGKLIRNSTKQSSRPSRTR